MSTARARSSGGRLAGRARSGRVKPMSDGEVPERTKTEELPPVGSGLGPEPRRVEEPEEAREAPARARVEPDSGRASALPWLLFIMSVVVLGGLAGYFARRSQAEATRADAADAERISVSARAREQDKTLEALQLRVKDLTDESKKAAAERDALAEQLKAVEDKGAGKTATTAKKPPPPPKKTVKKRK